MARRGGTADGTVRQVLAWVGLALMLASVVWWEISPRSPRSAQGGEKPLGGLVTRVVIDAGHGGNDSGTLRGSVLEKDLTLDVARRLDQLLRAKGLATTLTRSSDETVSLASRAAVANKERDCVFVSIHFDDGARAAATGVQTFYAARQTVKAPPALAWLPFFSRPSAIPNNLESQSLAGFVQEAMVAQTRAFNRGTKAEQFYVVANVHHPAVLVEGGFLSNNDDLAKVASEEYRHQLAVAIGDGIMRYRKIAGQAEATLAAAGGPRN
ncbi:MAG: N-acetylmuramoyl-L-alanine amidase [Chthoniobacterales bacterium]